MNNLQHVQTTRHATFVGWDVIMFNFQLTISIRVMCCFCRVMDKEPSCALGNRSMVKVVVSGRPDNSWYILGGGGGRRVATAMGKLFSMSMSLPFIGEAFQASDSRRERVAVVVVMGGGAGGAFILILSFHHVKYSRPTTQ